MSIFLIFFLVLFSANATDDLNGKLSQEELITQNLRELDLDIMTVPSNDVVLNKIKTYVIKRHKSASILIGRSMTYLPLFEKYLKEAGLPDDLKYLPIIESALKPRILSPVGAGGLWQFMPETGKSYGLTINKTIDERFDPDKSTRAAIEHLQDLYDRFGDWALVLAAYNSGAGRVNSAIRKSGSTDFWELRKYLPRETRDYVPAFIAAAYMMQYYDTHGIKPEYPPLDRQLIVPVTVYKQTSFFRIAEATGLSIKELRILNPAYFKDVIPGSKEGNTLIIPLRVLEKLEKNEIANSSAIVKVQSDSRMNDALYLQSNYYISQGQSIDDFARQIGYSPVHVKAWAQNKDISLQGLIPVYRPVTEADKILALRLPSVEPITTLGAPKIVQSVVAL